MTGKKLWLFMFLDNKNIKQIIDIKEQLLKRAVIEIY